MTSQQEQLEAILDTVFECGWEAGERYKEAKGGTTDVSDTLFKAKQDITALIQEAVNEGVRLRDRYIEDALSTLIPMWDEYTDEMYHLDRSADIMSFLRHEKVQDRIKQLSGGSNNE